MTAHASATDRPRSVTFTDDTPLMAWRATPDGQCTYCSPAWLRFTGRTLAQELGEGWLDSVHPDDRGARLSEYREAGRGRRGFASRYRLRRADGVYRHFEAIAAPVLTGGKLLGFSGASVDITEQLEADGHLAPVTDRLHAEYTAEVVYRIRVRPDLAFEYLSASVHRLTGRSPEEYHELLRRPDLALDLFVPEDRAKIMELIAEPERGAGPSVLRWKHADGRTLWIEHERTPVHDEHGRMVAVVGVARDVTRRTTLERQGQKHAALLAALVDHFDATLVESADGQMLLTNTAFSQLFGVPDSNTAAVREPSPDSARVRDLRDSAVATGERVPWPDGRVLQRDYVPVRAGDALVAHMWHYADVTAAVMNERAWIESKSRLRELAVHTEAVRETERRHLARMLHDDLGQAFSSIRLELITVISRFRQSAIPAQLDLVDRLQNAAGLIDVSLATVRRISTSLRPPVLDHLGLVAAIHWEADAFARRSGIRCRVTALPMNFELDRDRSTAVYRILLEALNNVAKHSKAGAVRIALLRRTGVLLVKIEDNGRGIRPEEAANPRTMGLLGMRERALPFGGDVSVGAAPRGGTRVLAMFPL